MSGWLRRWPFSPRADEQTGHVRDAHPVFGSFAPFDGWSEPGFERGFYGVNVRDWLYTGESKGNTQRQLVHIESPPIDEEYFEWIALMTAVLHARERFCMAEIGAGWGRWMISAAALCRQRSLPFRLVGVEAEPSHFEWLQMVLRDNDIDPDEQALLYGAASDRDREAVLLTGPDPPEKVWGHRTIRSDELPNWVGLPGYKLRTVPGFSLETALASCDRVDLVDVDIQGVEHEILEPAFDTLNAKVGVVHIGTHSTEAEESLRRAFQRHGWHNAFSFPCHSTTDTPFGPVTFTDGVETWVHPAGTDLLAALVASESPGLVSSPHVRHRR